jgi:hypothetical protein
MSSFTQKQAHDEAISCELHNYIARKILDSKSITEATDENTAQIFADLCFDSMDIEKEINGLLSLHPAFLGSDSPDEDLMAAVKALFKSIDSGLADALPEHQETKIKILQSWGAR